MVPQKLLYLMLSVTANVHLAVASVKYATDLRDGKQVIVRAERDPGKDRFSIGLCADSDLSEDCPLYISVRYDIQKVVRNTFRVGQGWGKDESRGRFPFNSNRTFEVKIVPQENRYQIFVNRKHFCDYYHRLPIELVKKISVSGVTDQTVTHAYLVPMDFTAENQIIVRFKTKANVYRTSINFCAGSDMHDVTPFHFELRFDKKQVVRNYYSLDEGWGDQRKDGDFPFKPSVEYKLKIVVQEDRCKIYVDHSYYGDFFHKIPVETAKNVYVEAVDWARVTTGSTWPLDLTDGKDVIVRGNTKPDVYWSSISLCYGSDLTDDCSLHLNMRFNDQKVIRTNYTASEGWGVTFADGDFPFTAGKPFEVKIVVEDEQYQIYVDGSHLCDYNYKQPIQNVHSIYFEGVSSPDVTNAYTVPIDLTSGTHINVQGVIEPDCRTFSINLCSGSDMTKDIALSFGPQFDENRVTRYSSSASEKWKHIERKGGFPFTAGEPYAVEIIAKQDKYKIYVNGSHFCNFLYQLPIDSVHEVYIEGKVSANVVIVSMSNPKQQDKLVSI